MIFLRMLTEAVSPNIEVIEHHTRLEHFYPGLKLIAEFALMRNGVNNDEGQRINSSVKLPHVRFDGARVLLLIMRRFSPPPSCRTLTSQAFRTRIDIFINSETSGTGMKGERPSKVSTMAIAPSFTYAALVGVTLSLFFEAPWSFKMAVAQYF
jgi:hypothetical protein